MPPILPWWTGRPLPRPPRRRRDCAPCFDDCLSKETGNPEHCLCQERFEALYEAECDRRLDEWREGGP